LPFGLRQPVLYASATKKAIRERTAQNWAILAPELHRDQQQLAADCVLFELQIGRLGGTDYCLYAVPPGWRYCQRHLDIRDDLIIAKNLFCWLARQTPLQLRRDA